MSRAVLSSDRGITRIGKVRISRAVLTLVITGLTFGCVVLCGSIPAAGEELLFDHRHTDLLLDVNLVHAARDSVKVLYVRLSHGRQITVGLLRLEDTDFSVCSGFDELCTESEALCVYNKETLPYDFWPEGGADSIRAVLDAEPDINMVMYAWCTHLHNYSLDDVDHYLASMDSLETEHPGVTFVYATGTAEEQGAYGFNRYLCNLKIRNHCLINGKLLYDFADIESWYGGERALYDHIGVDVPYLHPDLYGNDAEHASFLNCEYKAMVFWHMIVNSVFDLGIEDQEEPGGETPVAPFSVSIYPNPFNPRATISFVLDREGDVSMKVYDTTGRLVRDLARGSYDEGRHLESWDGLDDSGSPVASGIYLFQLRSGKQSITRKLVLMR